MAFESLTDRLAGVFKKLKGHGKLTEADIKAAMREVRMALLEADVNYKVAKDFCNKVAERAMGQEVMESLTPAQQVVKIVNEELTNLMGGEEAPRLVIKNKGQTVLMLCGLQGNGKTTHAAKLAKYYLKQGRRPLLVACDIYRPAAIDPGYRRPSADRRGPDGGAGPDQAGCACGRDPAGGGRHGRPGRGKRGPDLQ